MAPKLDFREQTLYIIGHMRGIEVGRETLKYVGKTAKEVTGVGPAQRAYRHTMLTEEGVPSGNDKRDKFKSLFLGASEGLLRIAFPFSHKSLEDNGQPVSDIGKGGMDLIVDMGIIAWAYFGHDGQGALIAKISYNTLAQVAPDVAKLAKGKFFYRAE